MEALNLITTEKARPRILIVEDNATQRILLGQIVKSAAPDAEIYWADSYKTATKTFKNEATPVESFDLMISDVFLNGDATGFDLCKDYFHLFKGHVILTSSFGDIEIPKLLQENFSGKEPIYLKKPLHLENAVSILKKLLIKS